nr:CaiB/BaiF CoA-transferase family protein [Sphingomonas sp. Y57]
MPGPLTGLRVIEFAGIGPGPFCAMMLADMGADVIRIERRRSAPAPDTDRSASFDITLRGRRSIALDLKKPAGLDIALALVRGADALIEGFRPGVMERLGLGPDACLASNPRLVYGRMTGWGQSGPLAQTAGHDLNYISLSGALNAIGTRDGCPVPPLNLVGDYGGGAMMLAFGVACGLLEAARSGKGQVVDAAMSDGAALLCALFYSLNAEGALDLRRESNFLDGGAHFYRTYACADGRYIAVGAIESPFYALLLDLLGFDHADFHPQMDHQRWPEWCERFAARFATRTRDEWVEILGGTDACFSPVLDWNEAPLHPHNAARSVFTTRDGLVQPSPAPRFSRTPGEIAGPPVRYGEDGEAILAELGLSAEERRSLKASEILG